MADIQHNPEAAFAGLMQAADLSHLFAALRDRGYRVVGPTVRDGDLVLAELAGPADLPVGWTDRAEAGLYRLTPADAGLYFSIRVGQQAWKKFLLPPVGEVWQARREADGWRVSLPDEAPPRYAFLGVRACDVAAIAVQDRVLKDGLHADAAYRVRREQALIIAVHCTEPGRTCFCASMNAGPQAAQGFDLALTELHHDGRHEFLVEVGSETGAGLLAAVPHYPADAAVTARADELLAQAAQKMGRTLDTAGIKEFFYRNYENSHWEKVAARCLSCGNCALVCPTCFCHTYEDLPDLTGDRVVRQRRQDVCFTLDYSYLHGGSIRVSPLSRYRQWLTHKLAAWHDQFGCSGCVGCGRCLTWCPVGIDLTAEVPALRQGDLNRGHAP
jgi:ferredoxin